MADLIDYLRDKLDACICSGCNVGRPEIGYYRVRYWVEGCPQHESDPFAEHNRAQFALIEAANIRAEARRKWWGRCGSF